MASRSLISPCPLISFSSITGKTWEKLKDKEIEDRIQEYPLNFQQEIQASDFLWFGKVVGNCGATYKLDDFCLLAPDVQYTGKVSINYFNDTLQRFCMY